MFRVLNLAGPVELFISLCLMISWTCLVVGVIVVCVFPIYVSVCIV